MNAKTEAAVRKHGENLLAIFTQATEKNPVDLCRKLRRLERDGEALGLVLCNGPEIGYEEADRRQAAILAKVDELLKYQAASVPVFLNRDPRGYALKIDEKWMQAARRDGKTTGAKGCCIHQDWGGYGIIAPDLTETK